MRIISVPPVLMAQLKAEGLLDYYLPTPQEINRQQRRKLKQKKKHEKRKGRYQTKKSA